MEKCLYSPFEFAEYRKRIEKKGVKFVRHARHAKLIMSSYLSVLKKYTKLKGKKFLLWTHEPYQDYTQSKKLVYEKTTIHIMNCYTKDVFTHNYRYFYFKTPLEPLEIDSEDEHTRLVLKDSDGPKMVALSTYYDRKYFEKNPKQTLDARYEIILFGYMRSYVDLYGKGWEKYPNVETKGESRNDKDRQKKKDEILSDYWFNICLENATGPYYITEKIWESVKAGCLPIYKSNETIYESFPKDSFIDPSDYQSVEEMYQYMELMTVKDYKERMNRCIAAFNNVIATGKNNTWRGKSKVPGINFLEYETCYKELSKKMLKI